MFTDIPAMGSDGQDLTIGYCDEYSTPTFKLIKATTGTEYNLNVDMPIWDNNEIFQLGIVAASENIVPDGYMISDVYPNPFNPSTSIVVDVANAVYVNISVYNVNGQVVSDLYSGELNQGSHTFLWDGSSQPSGIYFARLSVSGIRRTAKLMLIK